MQNYTNKSKKRPIIYRGWRYDAADHFNVSVSTITKWYENNNYELLKWLENRLQERERQQKEAIAIKKKIENNLKEASE